MNEHKNHAGIKHTSVESSTIRSIGYENGTLEVTFHHGGTYRYDGVPAHLYSKLMSGESKGKFFHAHIKSKFVGIKKENSK